ncbi:Hypothetical protein (Fragment) [Durusdinium trenchii]|uniref:Uncharacterized protein n=1 Tax=Durusdinium trenchii TaxID=1381693 RepID=A0ABP0RKZ2_9DINO
MAAAAEEVAHIAAIAEKPGGNARKCDPICADDLEPLEPHLGFAAAHSAAGKIHELLENLKAAKQKNTDEALSFDSCSNSLQKQLLSLRRAHRAMIKFSENGRVAEVAARKQTEVEFQNFQTRKYESSLATERRPPGHRVQVGGWALPFSGDTGAGTAATLDWWLSGRGWDSVRSAGWELGKEEPTRKPSRATPASGASSFWVSLQRCDAQPFGILAAFSAQGLGHGWAGGSVFSGVFIRSSKHRKHASGS